MIFFQNFKLFFLIYCFFSNLSCYSNEIARSNLFVTENYERDYSKHGDVLLVTVSDDRSGRKEGEYERTQNKIKALFENNSWFGIKRFQMWKWADLCQTDFYNENQVLLSNIQADRNGRAYKPFVILEGLKSLDEGEYLIYTDVSPELWDSFSENSVIPSIYDLSIIKKICDQNSGIVTVAPLCYKTHTHADLTLDRCIRRMGLWEFRGSIQHASGVWVIRKEQRSIDFVNEWLYWNVIDECASLGRADVPNDYSFWLDEYESKLGHRHDQSISGLLINRLGNALVVLPLDFVETKLAYHNFLQLARVGADCIYIDSNSGLILQKGK